MQFNLTVGLWIIPLIFTVCAMGWAIPLREDEHDRGGMFGGLAAISAVFRQGVTLIVCLIVWLIWALLR